MKLCRAIGARQASYGIWTGTDGTDNEWPWTLRESFQECTLSREYAKQGEVLETLPDDSTEAQIFDALAKYENWMTWAEQQEWVRQMYPDEFCRECRSPLSGSDDVCRELTCPEYGKPTSG